MPYLIFQRKTGTGAVHWLTALGAAGTEIGRGIDVDSSQNVYVAGYKDTDTVLVKYDRIGTVLWQRSLTANAEVFNNMVVDGAGNVICAGYTTGSGAGASDGLVVKYDTSGNVTWQVTIGGTGTDQINDVAVDSSNNVYVIGRTNSHTLTEAQWLLAKYNSSGTLQWQRRFGSTAGDDIGIGIAVTSAGDVYAVGSAWNSTGAATSNDMVLAKFNTSGTLQWQQTLYTSAVEENFRAVALDSAGNVYVVGSAEYPSATLYDAVIAKYNSSGTLQWQRRLGGASNEFLSAISIDSNDDLYVVGHTASAGAGGNDMLLAKYNSSGVLQFQRTLGASSGDIGFYGGSRVSGNDWYISGYTNSAGSGGNDIFAACLPKDGSKTGLYVVNGVTFTYQSSGLTDAAGSWTAATSTLTSNTSTLTSQTATLTPTALSLVQYRTPL